MPVSSRPRHPRRPGGNPKPSALPAYAHLVSSHDRILGGAALRGDEWALVLHGSVAAVTDSPSMVIAMMRHAAVILSVDGEQVDVRVADLLRTRAEAEAADEGHELEAYLGILEAERREQAEQRAQAARLLQ